MDIKTVTEITRGKLVRKGHNNFFEGVSTDSRGPVKGTLFIPLAGERFDGHKFLKNAAQNGAAGILVARGKEVLYEDIPDHTTIIEVADTLKGLGDIAGWWRRHTNIPIAAVTGSSGKTTTKEMIASIGNRSGHMIKSEGNFNNLVGLPLSLLSIRAFHDTGVFELGANRPGEIGRLAEIADPDFAVITNVGPAHLAGFGSIDAVREEKGRLFSSLKSGGTAIINRDDEHIRILEDRWRGKALTFGITEQAAVRAEHIFSRGERGVSFTIKIGGLACGIDMTTLGAHNIYNALAAASCCWAMGMGYEDICEGLRNFRQVDGRMTLYKFETGGALIDDTYNANPSSVAEALKTLNDLREQGESIVVLGDMLELGDRAKNAHEEVGRLVAATGASALFLKGEFSKFVASGALQGGMKCDRIHVNVSPGDVISELRTSFHRDLWILVKGSRSMRMDIFVEAIKKELGIVFSCSKRGCREL